MKILTTYDEGTRLIEKNFVGLKCKEISAKLKALGEDINETDGSVLVTELAFCKSMIEIMLQNFVIYGN